nr:MlrC C-terminal domain-containing protein [Chelatococcus asaccharovorans]
MLVLGDQGDRVLGGGSGDGTYILRHLIKTGSDLRALIPITDAAAVSAARAAGIGATVDIAVGGTIVGTERPVAAAWKVRNLTDGRFVQEGPFLANEPADMGPTAVLQSGNCMLVVSSRPALSQDPQAFISTGENPEEYDLVVCKSGFHFEMAFKRLGRCVVVDTPGLTNYVSGYFTFQRRPPLWPEAPHIVPDLQVRRFPPPPLPSGTKDVP